MIFPPPLDRKVLAGEKTEHRIPRSSVDDFHDYPHKPGDVLPVRREARGPWLGRVIVTEVLPAMLNEATAVDARREGFKRLDQFFAAWEEREMKFHPERAEPVWVIRFELDRTERGRFLAPLVGHLSSGDYTTSTEDPLDAGQVPPAEFVGAYTRNAHRAREDERLARKAARARKPLPERLADVLREARERGIPTDRAEQGIERRVESLEHRVERGPS